MRFENRNSKIRGFGVGCARINRILRRLCLIAFVWGSNEFLMANTAQLPPSIAAFLANERNGVSEEGSIHGDKGVIEFVHYVDGHWRYIIANFSDIAPDLRRKYLITTAAETLSPSDYLDFLNALCDAMASGSISQSFVDQIADGGAEKEGFLAYNYDKPRVADVIRKIERLSYASGRRSTDDKEFFTEMESGKLKQNAIQAWRDEEGDLPKRFETNPIVQFMIAFAPFLLGVVVSFHRVFRGRGLVSSFFIGWGLLVFCMCCFAIGIPIIGNFLRGYCPPYFFDWVPDIIAIPGMVFHGWIYAGLSVLLGVIARLGVRWWSNRKPQTSHE